MNIEITIVKTFCNYGHNFFKKQPFWPFFIRILAISCEKNLATLIVAVSGFGAELLLGGNVLCSILMACYRCFDICTKSQSFCK